MSDTGRAAVAYGGTNNVYLTQYFDWNRERSWKLRFVNSVLSGLGFKSRLVSPQSSGEQTSLEQRINLYHLAHLVLLNGVPGEFIEVGSHRGSTAVLLREVLRHFSPMRELHIYDAFVSSSAEELTNNFRALGLTPPLIHEGRCPETLSSQLPRQIAFAHLDVGWTQPPDEHRDTVVKCLEHLYPRMSAGAVCVVADYCDTDVFERQRFHKPHAVAASYNWSQYPSTKAACDQFFAGRPEKMVFLYGGPYSHGFFRKQPDQAAHGGTAPP